MRVSAFGGSGRIPQPPQDYLPRYPLGIVRPEEILPVVNFRATLVSPFPALVNAHQSPAPLCQRHFDLLRLGFLTLGHLDLEDPIFIVSPDLLLINCARQGE